MKAHANKTQENKRPSVVNNNSPKQKNSSSTFQFVDHRPEAIMQLKMQKMADNSFVKPIQKQEIEEEELLQGKFKTVQRQEIEEEELLQGKFKTVQRQEIEEEELLQGKFEPVQKKTNNTGLPDNLKNGIENLSGHSMDDVKVHRNSEKPGQLQAHAYAQGTDIHLGPGQEKHLPHEAWHVVQQKQGRVKPTMQMKGKVNVNDDVGLEKEADVMGTKATNILDKRATFQLAAFGNGEIENPVMIDTGVPGAGTILIHPDYNRAKKTIDDTFKGLQNDFPHILLAMKIRVVERILGNGTIAVNESFSNIRFGLEGMLKVLRNNYFIAEKLFDAR